MTPKVPTMLLEANFDIEQVGETLEWRFERWDGDGNPIKGKYAGGIYYTIGELMRVRVRAGSYKALRSFKVLDCALITRPQIVQIEPTMRSKTKFALPSPFVGNEWIEISGASVNLNARGFVEPKIPCPPQPDYYEIALEWDKHLTVGVNDGRWEISFVLTVQVIVDDGTRDGATYTRVFSFDPEGEVGTTVSPPK